jgi:predicted DNA-binding transcriptional regulator AlpA
MAVKSCIGPKQSNHRGNGVKNTTQGAEQVQQDDFLMDEKQVAKFLGISPKTLQMDRFKGRGIPYQKLLGRRLVRYWYSDVVAHARANRVQPRV